MSGELYTRLSYVTVMVNHSSCHASIPNTAFLTAFLTPSELPKGFQQHIKRFRRYFLLCQALCQTQHLPLLQALHLSVQLSQVQDELQKYHIPKELLHRVFIEHQTTLHKKNNSGTSCYKSGPKSSNKNTPRNQSYTVTLFTTYKTVLETNPTKRSPSCC